MAIPRSLAGYEHEQQIREAMEQGTLLSPSVVAEAEQARVLVVFVHGLTGFSTIGSHYPLLAFLQRELPAVLAAEHGGQAPVVEILPFRYLATFWAVSDPDVHSEALAAFLEHHAPRYDSVYLVGHSFGCLLIRAAVLRLSPATRARVRRMVFLAGTNRGFFPITAAQKAAAFGGRILQAALQPLKLDRLIPGRLAMSGLRGSNWLASLRLRWIHACRRHPPPPTVMLHGDRDRLVGPDDSSDVAFQGNSLVVRCLGVGHGHFTLSVEDGDESWVAPLLRQILHAFVQKIVPAPPPPLPPRELVAFLVHGIRDFGEWYETLGSAIERVAASCGFVPRIVPVTYGYFNTFQFLLSAQRRRSLRTFVDRYTQEVIRNPQATFVVAAHSNGTYAVARALEEVSSIQVDRIYFAGSVLPRSFRWGRLFQRGQIRDGVRNDCANADVPVGAMCYLLSWIPFFYGGDIGTGGVDGFVSRAHADDLPAGDPRLQNNQYLKGGHSAALEPRWHDQIAWFLVVGRTLARGLQLTGARRVFLYGWRVGLLAAVLGSFAALCVFGTPLVGWTIAATLAVVWLLSFV